MFDYHEVVAHRVITVIDTVYDRTDLATDEVDVVDAETTLGADD